MQKERKEIFQFWKRRNNKIQWLEKVWSSWEVRIENKVVKSKLKSVITISLVSTGEILIGWFKLGFPAKWKNRSSQIFFCNANLVFLCFFSMENFTQTAPGAQTKMWKLRQKCAGKKSLFELAVYLFSVKKVLCTIF